MQKGQESVVVWAGTPCVGGAQGEELEGGGKIARQIAKEPLGPADAIISHSPSVVTLQTSVVRWVSNKSLLMTLQVLIDLPFHS